MRKVNIDGKQYEVTDKREVGKAFVHKGIVYIFFGDKNNKVGKKAGVYIKDGKSKVKPYPEGKEITEADILEEDESAGSLDLFDEILANKANIIKSIDRPVLTKEEKNDIFAPSINEDDNILVRIVKTALKELQVNIKELDGFKDQMEMNNYKRSLLIHPKMSIERFDKWMEVLNYDWDVIYSPKNKK